MNKSQKTLMPLTGAEPTERFSLRFQEGVEIFEHEQVKRFQIGRAPAVAPCVPKLVVVENESPIGVVAKTRSEIAGLIGVLNALIAAR